MLSEWELYFNTLRKLKLSQVFYRVKRLLSGRQTDLFEIGDTLKINVSLGTVLFCVIGDGSFLA